MTPLAKKLLAAGEALEQQISDLDLTQEEVLLALSGGVDSITLFHAFLEVQAACGWRFACVHINHQLRAASEQEEKQVARLCADAGVPLAIRRWQHPPLTTGVEALARTFRYRAFQHVLRERDGRLLATAHHEDDQAETILMRLIRGSRLPSLGGMATLGPLFDTPDLYLWRPFLTVSKAAIQAAAQRGEYAYAEDESNQSRAYFRNRVRLDLLPAWEEENPNVSSQLAALSQEVRAWRGFAAQGLSQAVAALTESRVQGLAFSLKAFREYTPAEQVLLLEEMLGQVNADLARFPQAGLYDAVAFLTQGEPQGQWALPLGYYLWKTYDEVLITTTVPKAEIKQDEAEFSLELANVGAYPLPGGEEVVVSPQKPQDQAYFHFALAQGLTLRHRQPGDQLFLKGCRQKLRRFFINEKVPAKDRQAAWLLARDSQILGIYTDRWLYRAPEAAASHYLTFKPRQNSLPHTSFRG